MNAHAPRVLVTRAAHQSSALADALRALGAEPVVVPTIEIVPPQSYEPLDAALQRLDEFHWLLFTSANAVHVFVQRRVAGGKLRSRVAAIGGSTRQALVAAGYDVDLLPERAVAEAMASALKPHARRADGSPAHFLLIRAEEGREHLPEVLRTAGACVTVVSAYRTVLPPSSLALLRELFHADGSANIDAVAFTSSSSVNNLLQLLHSAERTLPPDVQRVSIGPITSATMRESGLPPTAEAEEAHMESLARTVVQALQERRLRRPG